MNRVHSVSRRSLLKSGGALIVSFASGVFLEPLTAQNSSLGPPSAQRSRSLKPTDVDSFLAVHQDGTVTIFTSHVDVGTGITTAYRQIAAEELGIPVERFTVIQGDTATVPNHGGTGGSSGVPRGGADIRRVAATARQALVQKAAERLGRPASELTIENGEVRLVGGGSGINVTDLVGGKQFDLKVDPNAPLKAPAKYTVVGKPILRPDVPAKSTGRHIYVQDFKVPGMLYGRVIRPPAFGARLLTVDEASIASIPDVRIVRIESFLGVVAKNEWAAVRAGRELKATWSAGAPLPVTENLDGAMGSAAGGEQQSIIQRGDTASALSGASKQVSASYYWPFQSHASLGPSCAVADAGDKGVTVWSSTQDAYGLRALLGKIFSVETEKIHVVYMDGSGSYGSNGAYDAAADAVLLSRAVGKPVRLQWTRRDEHALDPKGPAQLLELKGGLDKDGNIVAWESLGSAVGGPQWATSLLGPSAAGLIASNLQGVAAPVTHNIDPPYAVANLRVTTRGLESTPIRLSNLRAPGKMANVLAIESFTDELAAAAGMDPVAFRRRGLTDARAIAVIDRTAAMIGWQSRPSPNPQAAKNKTSNPGQTIGRGIAYIRYKQAEAYVAVAVEVSVDRRSGQVAVRRVACAHDCGLIMNPDGLRNQVEGNIVQALSRTLHEEVTADGSHVTSVDWTSYPILSFPEAPSIEVELLNHPEQPPYGAGEAAGTPVTAALANAIFDATGVRLRRVPFTAARVRAAMA